MTGAPNGVGSSDRLSDVATSKTVHRECVDYAEMLSAVEALTAEVRQLRAVLVPDAPTTLLGCQPGCGACPPDPPPPPPPLEDAA